MSSAQLPGNDPTLDINVDNGADAPGATAERQAKPRRQATVQPEPLLSAADKTSFQQLEASLGGQSGIAVSALGYDQHVERAGSLQEVIAWSTSKVPVAMAIYDAGLEGVQSPNLRAAITQSDNDAAMALWQALGSGEVAADASTAELRAAGDFTTDIESRTLAEGYTPFGQTLWSLADQARFVAGMPCLNAGREVLALMGEAVQPWGLAAVGVPAKHKGGWGPGSQPGGTGGYLERQMGMLTVDGKQIAIAIANLPADGSHPTGTRNLTAIAQWAVEHVDVSDASRRAQCS
ncbi:MAG TPA: hypothetical protein VFR97_02465 [Capillimicrobium sp.]|nr:hypothetical protein [Capillimicrobium sp.]